MFSNCQFKYGHAREFGEIMRTKTDKINNTATNINVIDFGGKNKKIRFENLKKLVTDFLLSQNIKFTVNPARVNARNRASLISKDTVIWNFKLNSVECFALIAINTAGEVVGLIYGDVASHFLNSSMGFQQYFYQSDGVVTYSTACPIDMHATMSKKYDTQIFIKDFYYFLKHFGEFKESYENFKDKKKLKYTISKQSSIALLSRLVKNHFDISVKIEGGFITAQTHDVQYGENKLTVTFDGYTHQAFFELHIRMNNETIYTGFFEFSTEKEIMKSATKIKNLAAFLNIVKGA